MFQNKKHEKLGINMSKFQTPIKREKGIKDEWPLTRIHYLIKEDREIEGNTKPDLVGRWKLTGGDNHGVLQKHLLVCQRWEGRGLTTEVHLSLCTMFENFHTW